MRNNDFNNEKKNIKNLSKVIAVLSIIIVIAIGLMISGFTSKVFATNYGNCGNGMYIDYDETWFEEVKGNREGVYFFIARSEAVYRDEANNEKGRTIIYVKRENGGLYTAQWIKSGWIQDEKYDLFAKKVEDYLLGVSDNEISK